jgi:autotransporter-associated beta strand protein
VDSESGLEISTANGPATILIGTLSGSGGTVGLVAGSSDAILQIGGDNTSTTFAGNIGESDTATLALEKVGSGTLTLDGDGEYFGGTTISSGILQVAAPNAINVFSGVIEFTGGVLQYGKSTTTDYSARLGTAANEQFKIDTNGNNVTYASPLTTSSGGSLTKLGIGTLQLMGTASTYAGPTTIAGGTLQVAGLSNALRAPRRAWANQATRRPISFSTAEHSATPVPAQPPTDSSR